MGRKIMRKKMEVAEQLTQNTREGNACFINGEMFEAIRHYNTALEAKPQDIDTLSNRGVAFTRIRSYDKAIKDFLLAMSLEGTPSVKTLHRFCKPKWALKEYNDLIFCLQNAERKYLGKRKNNQGDPEVKGIRELIETSKRMKMESLSGKYDMGHLILRKQQSYDCGEYKGPVEVKNIPEKGRGMVATSNIKAGSVIFASKAFALVFPKTATPQPDFEINPNFASDEQIQDTAADTFPKLIACIQDMLIANPSLIPEIFQLYSGPGLGLDSDDPVIKSIEEMDATFAQKKVARVVYYNAVISATNMNTQLEPHPDQVDDRKVINTYGIWLLASYLNHSCVGVNVELQKFGDFIIARAARNIAAGEEIVTNYSDPTRPYLARIAEIDLCYLMCKCKLCTFERAESEEVKKKRQRLLDAYQDIVDNNKTDGQNSVLQDIELKLEELRPNNADINFPIFKICKTIATLNAKLGMLAKAAGYWEKAYNLTSLCGIGRDRISICLNICICYMKILDEEKAREWTSNLKNDLIVHYGNISVFPNLAKSEGLDMTNRTRLMAYLLDNPSEENDEACEGEEGKENLYVDECKVLDALRCI